jgi:hypothetical protein
MAEIKNVYQTNFSGPLLTSFTTVLGGAAQNLALGGTPDEFEAWNLTQMGTPVDDKVYYFRWQSTMPSGSAFVATMNSILAREDTYITSNGVTPFKTGDRNLWVPNQTPYTVATAVGPSTSIPILTTISQASQAIVTTTHSFTAADVGVTWGTFSNVAGMTQINGLRGLITAVTGTTAFTVNIDTTGMSAFSLTGNPQFNVITGAPATTQFGSQVIQTPQRNLGLAGLTFGTTLMQTTSDVWHFVATFNGPVLG